jgi:hypothetical protein
MSWFYAPFIGNKPASTVVNGHRVVVVSPDPSNMADGLAVFGADRIKRLKIGGSETERFQALQRFSKRARGSVVVAPPDVEMVEVVENLKHELPWLQ